MSKGSDTFQAVIKKYLDDLANSDEAFGLFYENPSKSIEECCDFIVTQVESSGRQGFDDAEIYGLAVHYYQEENLGDIKKIDYNVLVNHQIQLTAEEVAEAKKKALDDIRRQEEMRIKAEEQKALDKAKKKSEEQKAQSIANGELFLFD